MNTLTNRERLSLITVLAGMLVVSSPIQASGEFTSSTTGTTVLAAAESTTPSGFSSENNSGTATQQRSDGKISNSNGTMPHSSGDMSSTNNMNSNMENIKNNNMGNINNNMEDMRNAAGNAADSSKLISAYEEVKARDTLRGGSIIGKDVVNTAGENIGEVKEIAVTPDGRVSNVVVSVGGFLGVGDRLVALPWNSLEISTATNEIKANVTKSDISQAPVFEDLSDDGLKLTLTEPKDK